MKKLTKEILQIILAIILMVSGLILILRYMDGRLLIGLLLMAIGALIFTVFARGLVVKRW